MTTNTISRPQIEGRLPRLRFGALIQAWIRHNTYRRQMHQLRMLDEHLLRDIGIAREDIPRRASAAALL